jgi:hypothetical protein
VTTRPNFLEDDDDGTPRPEDRGTWRGPKTQVDFELATTTFSAAYRDAAVAHERTRLEPYLRQQAQAAHLEATLERLRAERHERVAKGKV